MITRRTGGPAGAVEADGATSDVCAGVSPAAAGAAEVMAAVSTSGAAGGAGLAALAGTAATTGAAADAAGLAAGATTATTAGAATIAGRSVETADGGAATTTGGRAITGPAGGLLAMAGAGGFTTIFACCRGSGTIRRGAAACPGAGAGDEAAAAGAATTRGGVALTPEAEGGAATTAGRCGGGTAFTAASACLRSRMAFSASPGFDTLDRSNFGLLSAACRPAPLLRPPFFRYSRTRSAWSSSIELEWVFPGTPIASSASRIGLLFTSSSRARSLIRTLLIRPFSLPCAR